MLEIIKCIKCGVQIKNIDLSKDSIRCENCNSIYGIDDGIIDFSVIAEVTNTEDVNHTTKAFGWQWTNHSTGHNDGSKEYGKELFYDRYGLSEDEFAEYIKDKVVYDPAIGSGRMEYIYAPHAKEVYATDLSISVYEAKHYLKDTFDNINYFRGNLIDPPFLEDSFDVVLCHAIIQHTGNTFEALKSLTKVVKKDGLLFVDFYRKPTEIRDMTDNLIRKKMRQLEPDVADETLKSLTKLGEEFRKHTITIEEDIPFLDIEKGEYNLQRFMYYKLLKVFWNDNMSFDDNHNVMFDWFYPEISERYTLEEVQEWFNNIPELKIEKLVALEGGIGVIAKKI